MQKKCSACGKEFEPQGAFCPFCGQALDDVDNTPGDSAGDVPGEIVESQQASPATESSHCSQEAAVPSSEAAEKSSDSPSEESSTTPTADTVNPSYPAAAVVPNVTIAQDQPVEGSETPEDAEANANGTPSGKLSGAKAIIIAASIIVAIFAIVLIVYAFTRPQPLPLDSSITKYGMQVSYPSAWTTSNADTDGLYATYIKAADPTNGIVMFGSMTGDDVENVEDSAKENFDAFLEEVNPVRGNTKDFELGGWPARKIEVWKSFEGNSTKGYILLVQAGNHLLSCWAMASEGSDESMFLTAESIVDSVQIKVTEATVSFTTDQGKTIQTKTVYDDGSGVSITAPSAGDTDGRIIKNWKVTSGNAKISTASDGSTVVSDFSGDVTVEASTVEGWTVTFTDGNGKQVSTAVVENGKGATAPKAPSRTGYSFVGWDADFSNVTGNMTVNATWKELPKTYSSGTYRVGSDIPADEYAITSSGSGYWCVYSDTSKQDIVGNDNFKGRAYVTVHDGQLLEVSRGSFLSSSGCTPKDSIGTSEGTFKVGFDIPAGTYRLNQNGTTMAYYAVYGSSDADADIIDNDNFNGQNYVEVSDGQYLVLSRCTGEPA